MDPDVPAPSVEYDHQPVPVPTNTFRSFRDKTGSPLSSSPNRTPVKTPVAQPATPDSTRTPRSPSLHRNERRSTPNLQSQRSSSSLSISRGQTPSRVQLRRVSSNLNPASPVTMKPPEVPAPQPLTAETVAQDYFRRELRAHAQAEAQSRTIVIVHDSCYGHRFSRPRTSKAALSTIVERPERIHATLLGASTAYVQLGQRHADGTNGPHPDTDVTNLPNPPFILRKTTRSIPLNHGAVTHVHGTKWMEELQIMCDSAESKLAMNGKELQRPIGYGKDENGSSLPKLHEGDLYLSSESLAALQGCLGGVCDAVDAVFSSSMTSRAFVCIRPPGHHCSSNYPSGFCWLNNVHVGISYAAMNHGLTHAAIFDFDLHHGDGSQTITWDHNRKAQALPKNAPHHKKTPIGYYSLHDINSYPCEWGDEDKVRNASLCLENAHGQSIWNVHLEPWASLDHFWHLYEAKYKILLDKARTFLQHHSEKLRATGIEPKAAIFLSAGFDASQWEGQGMQRHNVNVPTEFYARFTADVVKLASQAELGVDGRIISVLEGGYSDRALTSGVLSHLCGLSGHVYETIPEIRETTPRSNGLAVGVPESNVAPSPGLTYDSQWWCETNLEALENRVAGIVTAPPKKVEKNPGTYSSPTQASTARMTDVAKERKSLSARHDYMLFEQSVEPAPPPPVDWVIAAYELSRILIPTDRQTLSCRHDELNAEATKARRDRQSAIGVAAPVEQRMQLRTRGKAPIAEPEPVRATSRSSNRRTTIAAVSELPDPSMPSQRPRRRSSGASSILSSFQDMRLDEGRAVQGARTDAVPGSSVIPDSAGTLGAKKTKMAPPAKKTAPRINSPRKAKAITQSGPKIVPLQEKLSTNRNSGKEPRSRSSSQSRPSIEELGAPDAVDDLTSGMKKVSIKLKMPTAEQHAENQKKADETKLKKPRAIRKPPVPKVGKPKTPLLPAAADSAPTAPQVQSKSVNTDPVLSELPPDAQHVPNNTGTNSVVNATSMEKVDKQENAWLPTVQAQPYPQSADVAVPHSNESSGLVPTSTLTQLSAVANTSMIPSIQGLERADNTVEKKTKADLPVFTSSSPIPFAKHLESVQKQESNYGQASSIWELPETPRR